MLRGACLVAIVLLAAPACSRGHGTILTLAAVPTHAQTIDVILASTTGAASGSDAYSGDTLEVSGQRETLATNGDANYFKQAHSFVGLVASTQTLRIDAEAGATDEGFAPFVIARDANGGIVALGLYDTGNGTAGEVQIHDDQELEYAITMEAVTAATPGATVAANQFLEVPCDEAATTFTSGLVWQRPGGGQHRLMFPDPAGATPDSAIGRPFDLDCDGISVAAAAGSSMRVDAETATSTDDRGDCDDLQPTVYSHAMAATCAAPTTSCDATVAGELSACTSAIATGADCAMLPTVPSALGPCTATGSAGSATCTPNPLCACTTEGGADCAICMLPAAAGLPCQPAAGTIALPMCAHCTVEIAAVSPPTWTVAASTSMSGTVVKLEVATTTPSIEASAGGLTQVAQVYLRVAGTSSASGNPALTPFIVAVGIDLAPTPGGGINPSCPTTGVADMTCAGVVLSN